MPDTRDTYRTVTPYLLVNDADAELAFLKAAFGASELNCQRKPDNTVMHAEVPDRRLARHARSGRRAMEAKAGSAVPMGGRRGRDVYAGSSGWRDLGKRARRQAVRAPKRRRRRPQRHHVVDRRARQIARGFSPVRLSGAEYPSCLEDGSQPRARYSIVEVGVRPFRSARRCRHVHCQCGARLCAKTMIR